MKQAGAPVIAGAGGWTIIDAIQVAGGGYDVAWKETGADQYTVWSLDANGNQTGNLAGGAVTGESVTLESFETILTVSRTSMAMVTPASMSRPAQLSRSRVPFPPPWELPRSGLAQRSNSAPPIPHRSHSAARPEC